MTSDPYKRKSKKDKRLKRKNRVYKRGGHRRTQKMSVIQYYKRYISGNLAIILLGSLIGVIFAGIVGVLIGGGIGAILISFGEDDA